MKLGATYEEKSIRGFKKSFCWWPKRLAMHMEKDGQKGFNFIGYVWLKETVLTRNMNYGWIAFIEYQTEENLKADSCPRCGAVLKVKS